MKKYTSFFLAILVGFTSNSYSQTSSDYVKIGNNKIMIDNAGAIKAFTMAIKLDNSNADAFDSRG